MGFFSWISSCGTVGESQTVGDDRPNLIRINTGNPRLDELRQAAAADVALIEQDNAHVDLPNPDEA
jgi:hypothetical protein